MLDLRPYVFEGLEGLPEAVREIIGRRKFWYVIIHCPFEDDDYAYVLIKYKAGRPRFQVVSGACLRPTLEHYKGQSVRKAFRTLHDLLSTY